MINLKNNRKEPPNKSTKTDFDELNKQIIEEKTEINEKLFKKHFHFQTPTAMLKYLHNLNDRNKNNKSVDIIKSELIDLKSEIKKMSEDEIKNEKLYKTVNIVENTLNFNKQNQQGKCLKILTISLAQLKAGNNSEKLKNEIRQILYSLYRSKN